MAFDLGGLLQKYVGGGTAAPAADAADHYQQVAQAASPAQVSQGLAAAFHSDQTPPFGQMVSQLFAQANPQQQAGMVGQLLSGLGPAALAALGKTGALGALAPQLAGATPAAITPQQAAQLTPDQVQQIAEHSQQHNPGIVDQMSDFYAQHSGLVKTLGSAALTIALAKIANNMKA
jgi:hypothetical protein